MLNPEYNISKTAGSQLGIKWSEESKQKMRGNKNGVNQKISEDGRKRISDSLIGNKRALGRHHTEEAKEKLRVANKGKVLSEEHRRKLSESHKGYVMPQEHKDKISKSLKKRSENG